MEIGDSDNEGDSDRKASQNEWLALEREVKSELHRKVLASGIRTDAPLAYDDVAGDETEDEDDDFSSAPSSPEAADAGEAAAPSATGDDAERIVPEGVTTAGDQVKVKKRSGKKRTGAERRKRKHDGEDGPPSKKKKEDEDPDRWLKMKLEGEEKPKRIDATRVVHYHDFDSIAAAAARTSAVEASSAEGAEEKPVVKPGSFRSAIRRDLFDGSDDDDDE